MKKFSSEINKSFDELPELELPELKRPNLDSLIDYWLDSPTDICSLVISFLEFQCIFKMVVGDVAYQDCLVAFKNPFCCAYIIRSEGVKIYYYEQRKTKCLSRVAVNIEMCRVGEHLLAVYYGTHQKHEVVIYDVADVCKVVRTLPVADTSPFLTLTSPSENIIISSSSRGTTILNVATGTTECVQTLPNPDFIQDTPYYVANERGFDDKTVLVNYKTHEKTEIASGCFLNPMAFNLRFFAGCNGKAISMFDAETNQVIAEDLPSVCMKLLPGNLFQFGCSIMNAQWKEIGKFSTLEQKYTMTQQISLIPDDERFAMIAGDELSFWK
jgi:hypothetical protein